jgi:magnesium transporter
MELFTKLYHPPGTSPGTLIERREPQAAPATIRLIDYTDDEFLEQEVSSALECRPYLERPTNTWIHVQGDISASELTVLGDILTLHPLALEDVLNTGQRPKLESYEKQLFLIASVLSLVGDECRVRQLSVFLGEDYAVSFLPGPDDPFEPLRKRLRHHSGKVRSRGIDYLLYALLDVVIDTAFPVVEKLGEDMEEVEDELLEEPGETLLPKLHQLRRELVLARRMLWPHRELLSDILRDEYPQVAPANLVFFRDCYDHALQIIELLDSFREMGNHMLELYLSNANQRLNQSMRLLTIIATIFIPLTFLVGIYGMNFAAESGSRWAMPELRWAYGYPLLWLVMIVLTGGLLWLFKRKRWM